MKDRITRAADGLRSRLKIRHAGIQTTITMSFTLIAGIYMILIGAILLIMIYGTYGFGYDAKAFIYGGF